MIETMSQRMRLVRWLRLSLAAIALAQALAIVAVWPRVYGARWMAMGQSQASQISVGVYRGDIWFDLASRPRGVSNFFEAVMQYYGWTGFGLIVLEAPIHEPEYLLNMLVIDVTDDAQATPRLHPGRRDEWFEQPSPATPHVAVRHFAANEKIAPTLFFPAWLIPLAFAAWPVGHWAVVLMRRVGSRAQGI